MANFKEIMYLLFVVVPISLWVVVKLGTLTLISFIINLFKRVHLRWKIKRTLLKNGIPRQQARSITKNYIRFLREFSSIRGITKIVRKTTGSTVSQTSKKQA
ncbi:MAG: hypothetical protein GF308_17470 [Candidatus Heimdallarchaeota archaeon]|nr:hypothetical protein [Candidatus Heimdallarchaeota archaeon]